MKRRFLLTACAALLFAGSAAARNPTDPPPPVSVSGSVSLVSDYRYRGLSRTARRPAVQGRLTAEHVSGAYGSVRASSVRDTVYGADAQIDLSAGYRRAFGGTSVDVGLLTYILPGADAPASSYFEPYASLAHTLGPVTATLSAAYAPKQSALSIGRGWEDNLYFAGDLAAGVPGTPVGLSAHLGRSFDASYATGGRRYTDWSLGGSYTRRGVTLGLDYVDTDTSVVTRRRRNAGGAGVVASVGFAF